MAKIVKQIVTEFDSCKECPYCQKLYSGMDGFGMQYLYDAATCKKGYWGSKQVGYDGNDTLWQAIQIPDFIPVFCEFSENPITGIESIKELVAKYTIEDILQWIESYKMDPNKTVSKRPQIKIEEEDDEECDKGLQEVLNTKYLYDTVNYLAEQGFNIVDEFKQYLN